MMFTETTFVFGRKGMTLSGRFESWPFHAVNRSRLVILNQTFSGTILANENAIPLLNRSVLSLGCDLLICGALITKHHRVRDLKNEWNLTWLSSWYSRCRRNNFRRKYFSDSHSPDRRNPLYPKNITTKENYRLTCEKLPFLCRYAIWDREERWLNQRKKKV